MKKKALLFIVVLLSFQANAQNWGFWDTTRSTVTINGTSYYLWNSGAGTFQGANFGTYALGATLPLTAYTVNTWKNSGGDVTGSAYYYSIYPTGSRPSSPIFTSLGGGWLSNIDANGNQIWGATGLSVNLLNALTAGNYTLEIYGQINGTGNPSGSQYDNNNSNATNYTATFTIAAPVISVSPSSGTFSSTVGVASSSQSFSVSGAYLISGVTATAPAEYQVSTDGNTWSNSITISSLAGGTLYVEYLPTVVENGVSATIALTSEDATEQDIIVTGTATLVSTGISSAVVSNVKIITATNMLTILNNGSMSIQLFSINGSLMDNANVTNQYTKQLPSGLYLLKINGDTSKVMIP